MIKRFFSAIFAAFIFGIILPIVYWFIFKSFPLDGINGILLLVASGAIIGATLGALFPAVFGFVFETILTET